MLIKIGKFEYTECWDDILYKKLSNYPRITAWEIQNVLDFLQYEKMYGRESKIEAEKSILDAINEYKLIYDNGIRINPPYRITECVACPKYKGCMTDFVCHTASKEDAISILKCGSLLSAVRARNKTDIELQKEKRNAACDPLDYFHYIMLAWGNCQAGDRLVMERKLERFPNEDDLSINFEPGIRFYFKYEDLCKHPNKIFDGVLPLKIKDEIVLKDYVYAIIIPKKYKKDFDTCIKEDLKAKVYYIENNCKDIWAWAEKVYEFVKNL